MKKDFLIDYEAKEIEAYERYRKQAQSNTNITFPELQRFRNAQPPLVIADTGSYGQEHKIWSQIPFASTLVIPLSNVSKQNLLKMNGFEVDDIPKLIELSKETGRVQFALSMTPKEYEGLEHFAQMFEELKPPMLQPIPMELFADPPTWEAWHDEFDAIAKVNYLNFMARRIKNRGESQRYFSALMNSHAFVYNRLQMLKMHDVVGAISEAMVNDPDLASRLLFAYDVLNGPFFDALHANRNMNFEKARLFGNEENVSRYPQYPVEVGAFLMKKMTLNPSSYYGCRDVIEHYKQNDLYKVLESMDRGIRNHKHDETISNVNELDSIMENVWKDANRIKVADEVAKQGMGLAVAAVGSFATSMLGGGVGIVEGLLTGLGFNVADRVLGKFDSSISNKLLRLLNKDYIMNIYDFQKKVSNN